MKHYQSLNFLMIFLTISVTSCAFSHVSRPNIDKYHNKFSRDHEIRSSPDKMKNDIREILMSMGYDIMTISDNLGLIRSKIRMVTVPEVCDCGTWNTGLVRGQAESTVVVRILPYTETVTKIEIDHECIMNFTGNNLLGATTRRETYQCASTGVIENKFWELLNQLQS